MQKLKVKGVQDRGKILNWEQTEVDIYFDQTQTTPVGQAKPNIRE